MISLRGSYAMSTDTSLTAELFSCHPRISLNPGKPGAFTAARTGSVLSQRLQSRRCSAVAHSSKQRQPRSGNIVVA